MIEISSDRVWVITELFPPEETSTGYIMGEIAYALSSKYKVGVICGPEVYDKNKQVNKTQPHLKNNNLDINRVESIKENKHSVISRAKKFLIISWRIYKIAKQKIAADDKAGFYDEMLKAIWGYLSDKLMMPVSELSKENIAAELASRQVSEELISKCVDLLSRCEFARYAPSLSNATDAKKYYDRAEELMDELESAIKNQK